MILVCKKGKRPIFNSFQPPLHTTTTLTRTQNASLAFSLIIFIYLFCLAFSFLWCVEVTFFLYSLWSFQGSRLVVNFFTRTQPWCKHTHADLSSYSSLQGLAGWNKVGWNNKFHCLHVGPEYRSTGRASSNIRVWLKRRGVAFPSSGNWLLSWQNSPFCIHHCSKHHPPRYLSFSCR